MSDENLEKPKFNYSEYLNKNKNKLIILSILIIFLIFAGLFLNELKKKQMIKVSENFNSAKILIEKKQKNEAKKLLISIIDVKNKFYSPSALNLIIEHNLIDDEKKIINFFDIIINEVNLDKEMKNLFIIKKTFFIGDSIKENILLNNLKPIIESNSIWKNTALDYIQKYYISQNQFEKAKQFDKSQN